MKHSTLSSHSAKILIAVLDEMEEGNSMISDTVRNAGLIIYGEEAILQALHDIALKHPKCKQLITPNELHSLLTIPVQAFLELSMELIEYPNFLKDSLIKAIKELEADNTNMMADIMYRIVDERDLDLVIYLANLRDTEGKRLLRSYAATDNQLILENAVINGDLKIVQYLVNLKDDNEDPFYQPIQWATTHQDDPIEKTPGMAICFLAAEYGQLDIARYLATIPDEEGETVIDYMKTGSKVMHPFYNNFSGISIINSLFKSQVPNLLPSIDSQAFNEQLPKTLAIYLNKEAELTKAAGLDSPHQVYMIKKGREKIFSKEILELNCCFWHGAPLLPLELMDLITATCLGITIDLLPITKAFQIPTEKEIDSIQAQRLGSMGYPTHLHLALLGKAVVAKNQLPKAV